MKFFRSGSYATVASTAALVVALGGTSYAAAQITSGDIKDGTIQTKDINKSARVTVKSVHNDNGTTMGLAKTVLTLNVPKGHYLVTSKAVGHATTTNSYASCSLLAPSGNVKDTSDWWAGSAVAGWGTVTNQAVMNIGNAGTIQLRCSGGTSILYDKKLTALRVASATDLTGTDVAKSAVSHLVRPKG